MPKVPPTTNKPTPKPAAKPTIVKPLQRIVTTKPVVPPPLEPLWYAEPTHKGGAIRAYHGHVIDILDRLPANSVHMCVTSPPYWGLRDYGTGTWHGGDPNCDHMKPRGVPRAERVKPNEIHNVAKGGNTHEAQESKQYESLCSKCGATREDQQLGSEPSPDCGTHGQAQCGKCFVCNMVAVFRGVRRVLRDDGTLWCNLGDTYCGGMTGGTGPASPIQGKDRNKALVNVMFDRQGDSGLPSGNLVGVPWRVALALQHDGWVLRQDIIWSKPSPMPESVTNRCTKAHEYIFLFAKSMDYYYDAEAIKEESKQSWDSKTFGKERTKADYLDNHQRDLQRTQFASNTQHINGVQTTTNKRSVWSIASASFKGAHFACFPPKLIEPCILAGTSAHGCCVKCGKPYERILAKEQLKRERPNDYVKRTGEDDTGNSCANTVADVRVETLGWQQACDCKVLSVFGNEMVSPGVKPCVVLDPFFGSGTTAQVARTHGRDCVGIDLSEDYLRNVAIGRLSSVFATFEPIFTEG